MTCIGNECIPSSTGAEGEGQASLGGRLPIGRGLTTRPTTEKQAFDTLGVPDAAPVLEESRTMSVRCCVVCVQHLSAVSLLRFLLERGDGRGPAGGWQY